MTKRERQLADYRQEVYVVECLGGPLDGDLLAVSTSTGVLHVKSGHALHVYERDEIHTGFAVRTVFRHVNVVEV
jgi:hypothetical protein